MKKIFIDCGFNEGQSLDHFLEIVPDSNEFEIFCFEPDSRNFHFFEKYQNFRNIKIEKSAVWIFDGEIKFFLGSTSPGSTLIKEKTTANIIEENFQIVNCIDLSRFIKESFSKDDYLILKLDVEGAEYKILDHIIRSECLDWIDDLFVEFHNEKVKRSLAENEHKILVDRLKSLGYNLCETPWEKESITYNMLKISRK